MNIPKYIFGFVLLVHGLIHLIGFAKAFQLARIDQLSMSISKPLGLVWLLTGIFFIVTFALAILKKEWWPILAIIAIVVSQVLIIIFWKDVKFGTIANIIILMVSITGFATIQFGNSYKKDVSSAMEKSNFREEIMTKKDLAPFPEPVQSYLRYVGVVGKAKVRNVKIIFEGEMREKGKDWFKFTSEQYNFFDEPTRLFFMRARIKGLPIHGYHSYKNRGARMQIKLLSLFPVVDIGEPELFRTETVTFFNDLCLFAPAALIDDRITWEIIDERSSKATFTNKGTTISAILYFNEKGQLVNFISEDRFVIDEMTAYPFSTPAKNYKSINGYNLATYGEATWHYPDGVFVYGKFNVKSVEYNVSKLN